MRRAVAGVGARGRGADEVERLADAELDAELVEDRLRGVGRAAQEHVGVDEREVADEDRHAVAEAAGRAPPRRVFVLAGELAVHRVAPAPDLGAVHDVVVHERERVHELERGRRVDHAPDRRASPPAPTNAHAQNAGPQALAARGDEVAQRVERIAERGVDLDPALLLGREQRVDAGLDPVGHRIERLGKGRGARRRGGHGERLRRGLGAAGIAGRRSP